MRILISILVRLRSDLELDLGGEPSIGGPPANQHAHLVLFIHNKYEGPPPSVWRPPDSTLTIVATAPKAPAAEVRGPGDPWRFADLCFCTVQ
jgi:hypothetical protein